MKFKSLVTVILFLSGCATTGNINQPIGQEKLNFSVPKNYKIAHQVQSNGQSILELIPQNETLGNWTRMVTIQTFENPEKYNPEKFINGMFQLADNPCENVFSTKILTSTINGFPYSHGSMRCDFKDKNKLGEAFTVKAIKGNKLFYVAQVASRTPMSNNEAQYWAYYVIGINVSAQE
ncbi:MAG: hypothetical protein WDA11_00860 [Thiohalomonadaceae bacterium]